MDGEKGCRGPARVALDRWHDQLEPWEKEVLERMLEAYKGGDASRVVADSDGKGNGCCP